MRQSSYSAHPLGRAIANGCFDQSLLFDAIRAVAGAEAVNRLRRERGGREVWIPVRAFIGNWLTDLIGIESAQKVVDKLIQFDADGLPIANRCYVARGRYSSNVKRFLQCTQLVQAGLRPYEIAAEMGLSNRQVHRYFAAMNAQSRYIKSKGVKIAERLPSKIRMGMFERMLMEGRDIDKIAQLFKIPKST